MALIKCPECGSDISDKAPACIHCGCPVPVQTPAAYAPPVPAASSAPAAPRRRSDRNAANAPRILSVNFHAVVTDAEGGKSSQTVYVQELNREVQFNINNSTKVGETIRTALREGSKYDYILFTAASVTQKPGAPAIPAASVAPAAPATPAAAPVASPGSRQSASDAIEKIKCYKPNWIVGYVRSRRYYTIMFLCIGLVGKFAMDGDFEMISIAVAATSPLWLPSLLAHLFYPMHHVKKYFRKHNLEEAIRCDIGYMNVAISAYNAMPGKKMLAYIRKLNPVAAQRIEQQLAASKKK